MADDYNLLNNFMDELRKTINEENEHETRSFNAQEFVAYLVSQASTDIDSEILDRIATESTVPVLLTQLSMLGLSAFIGATLDEWFEAKVSNWKDVPADFRKELVIEVLSHIGVAFMFAGDDS